MDEKRVKIGVDTGDVDAVLRRLQNNTKEIFSEMVKASRSYSTSAREVLSDLETQIRLLERRNVLERAERVGSTHKRFLSKEITPEQYRSEVSGINRDIAQKDRQADLLRELIETVRQQAKTEIRENRANVEKQIENSKDVNKLNPKGDPTEILKQSIQQYELGRVGQDEIKQKRAFQYSRAGKLLNTGGAEIASSQNEFYAAAAMMAMIPFVGQGLGALANKAISNADKLENSVESISRMVGAPVNAFTELTKTIFSRGVGRMGLTPAEVYEKWGGYSSALGTSSMDMETALNLYAASRSMPINSGQIEKLLETQRYTDQFAFNGKWVSTTSNVLTSTEDYFSRTGRSRTQMSEYLDIIIGLMSSHIQRGSVGEYMGQTSMVQAVVQGISTALNISGTNLSRFTTAFDRGLTSPSNDVVNVLQMRTLSRLFPEKDVWELMEAREAGLQTPGYLTGVMGDLERYYKRGSVPYKSALKRTFSDLSYSDITRYSRLSASELESAISSEWGRSQEVGEKDFTKSVDQFVGVLEKSTKKIDSFFQEKGESLVVGTDEMIKKISSLFSSNSDFSTNMEKSVAKGVFKGLDDFYKNNPEVGRRGDTL